MKIRPIILIMMFATACSLSSCATVSSLGRAAKAGDMNLVKTLLDSGYDVNATVTPGLSPLHEAVFNNASIDIVRLMIDRGADVNKISCGDGWASTCNCGTALYLAACKGNIGLMALLIDRGANLEIADRSGYTPLAIAATENHAEAVKLLVEKGADTEIARRTLLMNKNPGAISLIDITETRGKKRQPVLADTTPSPAPAVSSDVDDVPSGKSPRRENACAIVIGIERYRQDLPKADYADRDAGTVADYLVKAMGYPEENVVVLRNDRAALGDFVKYFEKWLPNNVEKDGTVFIYYSGHGAPDPKTGSAYLVPYDGDPSFIAETGYSLKRLYGALEKLPAKTVIVALDSCFSGAGGRSVLAKGARPLVMNLKNETVHSNTMTVITASSGEQVSATYDEKGHGLFTYFFLKGIRNENVVGPDGTLSMDDLFGYVGPQVERIARKRFNTEQTPQLLH